MAPFNRIVLGALLGLGVPASLLGQDSIIPLRPFGCTFDSAAASEVITLYLSLSPSATDSRHVRAALPVAMAVAANYRQPERLTIHSWPGTIFPTVTETGGSDSLVTYVGLSGTLLFELDHDSRLTSWTPVVTTDSPDLNLALTQALVRAATEGSLAPATGRQSFLITESPLPSPDAVSLAHIELRGIAVDQAPRFISAPTLAYPQAAAKKGLGDTVLIQFIIRADGSVAPESVRVVRATYQDFIDSALRTVLGARFEPAKVRGCPVSVRVTEALRFKAH